MIETTNKLRQVLKRISGINLDPKKEEIKVNAFLIFVLISYVLLQTILVLITNWSSVKKRFLAVEDLNLIWFTLNCLLWYMMNPKDVNNLLKISDHQYFEVMSSCNKEKDFYDEKLKLVKLMETQERRAVDNISKVIVLAFLGESIPNLLVGAFMYIIQHKNIEELPLPIEFHNIFKENMSIHIYLLIFIIEAYVFAVTCAYAFIMFAGPFISIENIVVEMKLFNISIKEIDYSCGEYNSCKVSNGCYRSSIIYEPILRRQLHQLVIHHQLICRKVEALNKYGGVPSLLLDQAYCIQICMALCAFQGGTLESKIKEVLSVLCTLFACYLKCNNGQKLSDTGQELRERLWNSKWYEKPKWYKVSLHLMMTRASKFPEVKPFGLYVMNNNSFKMILRASYSYFNFLRNFY